MAKKVTNQEALEIALQEENYPLAESIQSRINKGEIYTPEYQLVSLSRVFFEKMLGAQDKDDIIKNLITISSLNTQEQKYQQLQNLFDIM